MSLAAIKLVTFDATNTLLKFKVPPWQYYAMVACDHGYSVCTSSLKEPLKDSFKVMWKMYPNFGKSTMSWEDWWRKVVKLTFQKVLPSNTDTDPIANTLINEFRTSKCWTKADKGDELVKLLKQKGITVGVISNFDPRLKDILCDVGLHKCFQFIITSYDIGVSKPDPKIFDFALKTYNPNSKPTEALHIGDDMKNDYHGAKAAGWHALIINPDLTETPPANKHVFNDLQQLYTSIEKGTLSLE